MKTIFFFLLHAASERQRVKAFFLFLFLCLSATAARAQVYSDTTYVGSVHTQAWAAISGISAGITNGGYYTNSLWRTNTYRLSATNLSGRLPLTTNITVAYYGSTNLSNAVSLAWTRPGGVARQVVEKSYDLGSTWTNWLTLQPLATNWLDTGSNVWTLTSYTGLVSEIPASTYPWFTLSTADLVNTTQWQASNANIAASAMARNETNQWAIDLTNRTIQAMGGVVSTGGLASIVYVDASTNTADLVRHDSWVSSNLTFLSRGETGAVFIATTNAAVQAIGSISGISAATATSIAETVVAPYTNIIGTVSNNVTGLVNGTNDYLRRDGTLAMTGPLGMGQNPITNVSHLSVSSVEGEVGTGGRMIIGKRQYTDGGFPHNIDEYSFGSAILGYIGGMDTPQIVASEGCMMLGRWQSENSVISNSYGSLMMGQCYFGGVWSGGDQGPEIVDSRGALLMGEWGGGRVQLGPLAHGSVIMGVNISRGLPGDDVMNGGATNAAMGSLLMFAWDGPNSNHTAWIKEGADMSIGQGDVVVSNPMCIVSGQGQVSHGSGTHTAENGFWHGTTNIDSKYLALNLTNQFAIDITNRTIQAMGSASTGGLASIIYVDAATNALRTDGTNAAVQASRVWTNGLVGAETDPLYSAASNTFARASSLNTYLRRDGATGNSLMTGPLGMGQQPITNFSYIMSAGVESVDNTLGGRMIIGRRQYRDGGFPGNIDTNSHGSAIFGYIGGLDTPQIVNSAGAIMAGYFKSENSVISNSIGSMILGHVNHTGPWSPGDNGPEIVSTRGGLIMGEWGGGRTYLGSGASGSMIIGRNVNGTNIWGGCTNTASGSILQFGFADAVSYEGNSAWIKEGADMSIGQGAVIVSNPMCIVSGNGQTSHGSATHTAGGGFWHGTTNILTQMTNEVSQKLFGGTNIIAQLGIISNAIVAGGSTTDTVARAWLDTLTASQQVDRVWLGLLDGSNQVTRTMAAGATSTGQTAVVMATGLTSTQQVHATWLGLLADSGTVTRALATRAITNIVPVSFQTATQEIWWIAKASQDYTLKTITGSCSNGPVTGDVVLRQSGTAWMSQILVANPSISISTGGVTDTTWDIGVWSNGWIIGWWCTNTANATPYDFQIEATGNQ